jgi:pyruvate/2-oxoglutarate dehydrogenase complex dihydrolipoamide acyltransferase (E2) component
MKISTAGIKLLACGALIALGVTVGSGTAHAALVQPTAEQCKMYAQYAIDEGEGETLAQELLEHGFDPAGCPSGPVVVGECVLGHNAVTGEHCYTEGYSDPKDRPAGYPVPAVDCRDTIDYDDDFDCTPWPPATATEASASAPAAPAAPAAVNGVTVSNAAPAATAAATPAKPATVSTPALAAAAKPAATPAATVKALPLTGGNISGVVLFAVTSLGIGVALRRFDKRRRLAA